MSKPEYKMVRVPKGLHRKLKMQAAKEEVSLAQLIERLLKESTQSLSAA